MLPNGFYHPAIYHCQNLLHKYNYVYNWLILLESCLFNTCVNLKNFVKGGKR
mgnify:FL=1